MNLDKLMKWCQDAHTFLPMPELPPYIYNMRMDIIKKNAGTKKLYDIAEDLAEGISFLPMHERDAAQDFLLKKYGFGYDFFTDKKFKRIKYVLNKGKISNDNAYEDVLNFIADVDVDVRLSESLRKILIEYEKKKGA